MSPDELAIGPENWQLEGLIDSEESETNFPESRLLAGVIINGHPFHVEAYAVSRSESGMLETTNPYFFENLNAINTLLSDVSPSTQEITINGVTREYVVVVFPSGE